MTFKTEHRNPVEVLSEEFLDRRRRGEPLSVGQFAELHPEFSDKIRRLFPAMLALENCKSSRLSTSGSSGPVDLGMEGLTQLGDFRIVCEIGRGGMGVVYEAEQQSLQRRVAVKVFPRQALPDSRHLDRFHREAKTAARLHHTNIVPVFGVGQQDDLHYYVMQRIDGTSLDEIIQRCEQMQRDSSLQRSSVPGSNLGIDGRVGSETNAIVCNQPAHDDTDRPERTETSIPRLVQQPGLDPSTAQAMQASQPRFRSPGELIHQVPASSEQWRLLSDRGGQPLWNAIANVGIQIADALDYAHLQGVLHRDIKPSNLLLDRQGTVWVTDFGLATVLESEQRSHPEEVAGTLRFMAPEHIGGTQDTRSDIYSLGLTLYELLTLKPAFSDSSRTLMLSKIMKGEFASPREIRRDIPKDLEAIIMRAMSRESTSRYACAGDLASDLRRFVQGRPVAARPVSAPLKLWRWTARNPMVATLCMALLLTGITSFFVVGAKWKDAVAENQRAEVNLALALESLDQILERFTSSWMAQPISSEVAGSELDAEGMQLQMAVSDHSAEVLQDALKFYDRFAQQNPTNPQLYRDTAKVHRRVADIYQRLGQQAKAEEAYQRSLGFLSSDQIANDASLELERVETLNQLGFSLYSASRFGEAEREFRRALEQVSETVQGGTPLGRAEEARIGTNLAQCLSLMFRGDEARQTQRAAVEVLEQLVKEYPDDAAYQLELARAYRSQHWLLGSRRGSSPQDERNAIRDAGIEILEGLVRSYPNVPDYRCELSELLVKTSSRSSRDENGSTEVQRAVDMARELYESHPSIPRYRAVLALGLMKLADCQCGKKRDEADRLFEESISHFRSLTRAFPDMPVYRVFLVFALHDQAETLHRLGHYQEAYEAMATAVDEQTRYVELRPDNYSGQKFLAHFKRELDEMRADIMPADD